MAGRSTGSLDIRKMRQDTLEIYSDATNAAVVRHPGRRFPGVLVQGDTLHTLYVAADNSCKAGQGRLSEDAYLELCELRDHLRDLLDHYKQVLSDHQIGLPFVERPDV